MNFAGICHLACSFILITRPSQEHACQTQPPPRSNYKDYCNAWIIYDAYENDIENRPKQNKQQDQGGEQETGTGGGTGRGDMTDQNASKGGNAPSNNNKDATKDQTQGQKEKDKEGK